MAKAFKCRHCKGPRAHNTTYCSDECRIAGMTKRPKVGGKLCKRAECKKRIPGNLTYCSHDCRLEDQPVKVRKETKEEVRIRLEDRFIEQALGYLKLNPGRTTKLRPAKINKKHSSPHEMVLMLSDAHYPEVVDPEVAMGLKYNGDICVRRLERVRDVVLRYRELREMSYPVKKLTIAMLGDMISGDIHEELEVTNEYNTPEALVKLAYYLHSMFDSLAQEFPEVEVIAIPGNHPRTTKKPRFKQKTTTNFEYILGHFIAALAQQSRYTVQVPKDLVYRHKVFDYNIAMTHGDGQKSASYAGIPFYGIKQRMDALQSLMRHFKQQGIDYLLMGHFHQPTILPATDSKTIINGSIKGGDEFSLGTRFASNDPEQLLLTYHKRHGLTDISHISLGEVR